MSVDAPEEHDPVDALIASYLEERQSSTSRAELTTIRQRYLDSNPQHVDELEEYFAGEDSLGQELRGIPTRIPDFDDFEQISILGHGGMGVVYRAHQKSLKRNVALKMSLPGFAAQTAARFRAEAERMAKLSHPNIVPVYEVKELDGQVFFTMKLLRGGSVEDRLADYRDDHRAAAQLVVKIARAVQFAHQRGTLHRDLKPANIVLDESGRPYVTDFGLAKAFTADELADAERRAPAAASTGRVGTPYYMSPEQAAGLPVNTATDVYGLGSILYVLLSGKPPIERRQGEDDLEPARERGPTPLRQIVPKIDRDLEAICLRCLEREPAQRWGSADALANALEQWIDGRESIRPWSPTERCWRWGRRQPLTALLLVAVVTLVAAADIWSARTRLHERKRQVDQSNINVAQSVAATERERLRRLRFAVFDAALDSALQEQLDGGVASAETSENLHEWLRDVHRRFEEPAFGFASSDQAKPFDSWFILDEDGSYLAHSTEKKIEGNFRWRDYYRGAMKIAADPRAPPYISKVYLAQRGGHYYKFGIAKPIYVNGRPRAVLVASVLTETTRGHLLPATSQQIAAIVAPRDRIGPEAQLPPEKVILGHPHYEPGERAVEVSHPGLESMDAGMFVTDSYRDPILGEDWVAAFVPLADTEFVVVVQQPYERAIGAKRVWGGLIGRWAGGLALVVLLFLASTLWHRRRVRLAQVPNA